MFLNFILHASRAKVSRAGKYSNIEKTQPNDCVFYAIFNVYVFFYNYLNFL